MFTPGFDPVWAYKQRHMELIQEAQRQRLVNEALKARMPKTRAASKILALVGRGLVALGTRLEERNDMQPGKEAALNHQGSNI